MQKQSFSAKKLEKVMNFAFFFLYLQKNGDSSYRFNLLKL